MLLYEKVFAFNDFEDKKRVTKNPQYIIVKAFIRKVK